jgi:hypothetical protein
VSMEHGYELSPQQRRAWSTEGGAGLRVRLRVEGVRAAAWWPQAITRASERHELLRTEIRATQGLPLQYIHPTPLPAERTPLQIQAADDVLDLTLPATHADAGTLAALLDALLDGEAAAPAADQYADAAAWLLDLLEATGDGKAVPVASQAAWAATRPPGTHPDPGPFQPAALRLDDLDSSDPLVLLVAWWVLAARQGVAEAVGLECDGRDNPAVANLLGPLARTVPLTVAWQPDQPLASLPAVLEAAQKAARAWQWHYDPNELGSGWLALPFAVHPTPAPLQAGGVTLTVLESVATTERFTARLRVDPARQAVWLDYDRAALAARQAQQLVRGLHAVLATLHADPPRPIRQRANRHRCWRWGVARHWPIRRW